MTHAHDHRQVKVTDLPGDVQIDLVIRKLFRSNKCIDAMVERKVHAALSALRK